ncbi:MAG TPA: glycosyltransferase [Candidatus Kryptonia bacterium]
MSFEGLLGIFILLYIIELGFYSYAANISRRSSRSIRNLSTLPRVSVVIAAKDEEVNLPACLKSVVELDYPADLLEVIVVNDDSSDSTPAVIDGYSRITNTVRRVDAVETKTLKGKANALSQGIANASGEFIFLTDADCIVPKGWIKETLKYFDPDVGIVGGVTLISQTDKAVYGMQALDWDFLLTVCAGAATLHKPIACLGNNLVVRKKAYEDVGGYSRIRFSVTEDFALYKAIAESGKWRFAFPMDRNTLVETKPVGTLKDVFSQRKRWGTGGKDTGIFGFLTLGAGFMLHWAIIISPFVSLEAFGLGLIAKIILDSVFVLPTLSHYGKIAHLKFILYFEIYYITYVAILPFLVYVGKGVTWKGRNY